MLFIAGTRLFGDVLDDLRIPFNDVEDTQRYRDACAQMSGVTVVVGHSLGGAVAIALAHQYQDTPVTYAAPVVDFDFQEVITVIEFFSIPLPLWIQQRSWDCSFNTIKRIPWHFAQNVKNIVFFSPFFF